MEREGAALWDHVCLLMGSERAIQDTEHKEPYRTERSKRRGEEKRGLRWQGTLKANEIMLGEFPFHFFSYEIEPECYGDLIEMVSLIK